MPELEASGDLFEARGDAGFETGIVHGRVAGGARVGVTASAEVCHGAEVALGVEALAEVQAMLAVLLPAIRAEGQAFASAGVRVQLQLSPDLFDKIGFTAAAEAQAQASVAGRIAIGLDFHAVASLARTQLSGLAAEVFIAFLNELVVEAGVWGKASFAAMAHAHVAVNGSLADDEDARFIITAGAGAGWGGGTGWDFYAGLHFKDVKRFYNHAAHLITDEVVRRAKSLLPREHRPGIELVDLLLPTILVASFELGQMSALELVRWGANTDANAAPFGHAFRRQLQRFAIDKLTEASLVLIERHLDLLVARAAPDSLPPDRRDALQDRVRALVDELRGGLTVARFPILVSGLTEIVETLFPDELARWRRPISILWCALTLGEAMRVAGTNATAGGSVSVVGLGGFSQQASIDSIPQPPSIVRDELARFFDPAPEPLTPADAVDYLATVGLVPFLEDTLPDVASMLRDLSELLSGQFELTPGDLVEAALRGLAGEDLTDTDLYLSVSSWLRESVEERVLDETLPALRAALSDDGASELDEELLLYLDEVVEPCFHLASNFVLNGMDTLVSVATRPAPGSEFFGGFRHGLGVLAWRVFSRNIVVISDILLSTAIEHLGAGFEELHQSIADDPSHPFVRAAADLTEVALPWIDTGQDHVRAAVHELFGELTLAGAVAFGPTVWTQSRRDRMRGLMIHLLESIDTGLDHRDGDAVDEFFDQLAECFFIPDLAALQSLGQLLLEVTVDELAVVFERIVPALEVFWLRLTLVTIEALEQAAHELIEELAAIVRAAWEELQRIAAEVDRLIELVADFAADAAEELDQAADVLRKPAVVDAILAEVRDRGLADAESTARAVPGFTLLGANERNAAIATAQGAFLLAWLGIEPLLRGGLAVIAVTADALGEIARDASDLPSLVAAVADDVRDRVESSVEALGIPWPSEIDLDDVTAAARDVVSGLASIAIPLQEALDALLLEREARDVLEEARAQRIAADERLRANRALADDAVADDVAVRVRSPHPLARQAQANWLYPREVPVSIEIAGARAGFVHADSPQRVLLAVNGRPWTIAPGRWRFDEATRTLRLDHLLTASEGGLRDGLNTLEVSIATGRDAPLRTAVSFAVDTSVAPLPGLLRVAEELSTFDTPGNDHAETPLECVALENAGDGSLDLTRWRVQDRAGHRYVFSNFQLLPRSVVRVHTGSGTDDAESVHWGRRAAIWNNRGDTVLVIDAGSVLRAEHSYGRPVDV